MKGRLRYAIAFSIIGILAASGWAADSAEQPKGPDEVITETVDKVLEVLEDPDYKDDAKRAGLRDKIRDILLKTTDMEVLGSLALGQYKKKFTPEQFEAYLDTFSRLLFFTYISHIENYSNEKVVILETKHQTEVRVLVKTKVVSDNSEVPIDYTLGRRNEVWKVFDVYVEGVSLVKNYRSQFRDILRKDSADDFLKRIEKKVEQNEEKS